MKMRAVLQIAVVRPGLAFRANSSETTKAAFAKFLAKDADILKTKEADQASGQVSEQASEQDSKSQLSFFDLKSVA